VLFPGYTVTQAFGSLGTGIAQPFGLSQGMPLVAVQNLKDPQSTVSQFNASNPIWASASFAQLNPLPYALEYNFGDGAGLTPASRQPGFRQVAAARVAMFTRQQTCAATAVK
jgi:hypothetical protein